MGQFEKKCDFEVFETFPRVSRDTPYETIEQHSENIPYKSMINLKRIFYNQWNQYEISVS